MPLKLIHGPPNSGRAGLIRRRFSAALERDPVLVVPTVDDVHSFERELCEGGAALGGAVTTFGGLFGAVASAGGSPPAGELTPAQRLRAVALAVGEWRGGLGPLRRSAARPGFAVAFERLLDELQAAGLGPAAVEAAAATLEGSAYLGDLAALFGGYVEVRDRLCRSDAHGTARRAVELLQEADGLWQRPVFLYGFDDLTGNQLELTRALAASCEVTVALTYEEGNAALAARAGLLERLRELGVAEETATEPDPGNTPSPLLFHLERGFGAAAPERRTADGGALTILRSAGVRGEAEAIGAEVAKLIAAGGDPGGIAIALRDPVRRGPPIASVLESCGVATALEAEVPIAATSIGGALPALLAAALGDGTAADLLRFLRGPSGVSPARVDCFERAVRRRRVRDAAAALDLWRERYEELPHDVARIREAAAGGAVELASAVGRLATTMAARPLRGDGDGPPPGAGDGLELRAAAAVSSALADLAEPAELAPPPAEIGATIERLRLRVWSGPVEGRVRIANPYRLRAARFDHVFVASLQDGEFPRWDGGDPFLAESQRAALGIEPRRDVDAEERYLFHACLALPRERLFLSWRDCDEDGVAEPRSPLLDEVRRLLDPPPAEPPDPVEERLTRSRDLTRVTAPVAEAPSERELARAIAARGPAADAGALLDAAGAAGAAAERVAARIGAAREGEAATRAPGPLAAPAVLDALRAVPAYGGTTLEGFDLCSYRWFVSHELDPQPLDPVPDPLLQGGLMHAVLERLYEERPGGDALPRPASLGGWIGRGRALLAEEAERRELGGHPAERAIVRRVEGLLRRFLAEEAARETGGFEPWLLEARFGEEEGSERPELEVDGWRLHGAIDRVDRDPAGRALVVDYKLSGAVTPRARLEQEAKLQLQLYLIAAAELWDVEPVGGIYHPLGGTSSRRPRGLVLREAPDLDAYGLAGPDLVDREQLEATLEDARRRAGEIVARMRRGDIRRDPGPRRGLPGHGVCPPFCDFAPICRRDRAPAEPRKEEAGES
jgi:ATP-dependent helicase/DNAse subunit B